MRCHTFASENRVKKLARLTFNKSLLWSMAKMISFLEFWLCTLSLTSGGIVHQAFTGGQHIALLFQVLGGHIVTIIGFAIYWMVLYPQYFTPFSNIPTPSVRISNLCRTYLRKSCQLTSTRIEASSLEITPFSSPTMLGFLSGNSQKLPPMKVSSESIRP